MQHEVQIIKGLAAVCVFEKATAEGFSAVARAIAEAPGWQPGMNILVDYEFLDLSEVTQNDVKMFASAFAPYREKLGNGLCACVNTQRARFGLGRMWQVFMEDYSDLRVAIFYDCAQALHWLSGVIELE